MCPPIIEQFIENYSIITIHGTKELYIENFISIIMLTENQAKIRAKKEIIEICGEALTIEYLNKDDIKLCGMINSIKLTGVET